MKLISLNIEGDRHYEQVKPFLAAEDPDIICLMEAPEAFSFYLNGLGYHTTFAPIITRTYALEPFFEGTLFASKVPHTAELLQYQDPNLKEYAHDPAARTLIFATTPDIAVATTHFTISYRDEPHQNLQEENLDKIFDFLKSRPTHILCGDLNIVRNWSPLYHKLTEKYTDQIPKRYASSMDQAIHRHKDNPDMKFIFETCMVDHLLTQLPYQARDVRLEFGISDHAAVVAEITRE